MYLPSHVHSVSSNEVEDLKDKVHDLEVELQESEDDKVRLKEDVKGLEEDNQLLQKENEFLTKELDELDEKHAHEMSEATNTITNLTKKLDVHSHKYLKALSIAAPFANNDAEYFKTDNWNNLLSWASGELKREMDRIVGGWDGKI